jgi:hypothetical protein
VVMIVILRLRHLYDGSSNKVMYNVASGDLWEDCERTYNVTKSDQ